MNNLLGASFLKSILALLVFTGVANAGGVHCKQCPAESRACMPIPNCQADLPGSKIFCRGSSILFGKPVGELSIGENPVELLNFPLALKSSVIVERIAPLGMLQIGLDTAYCHFSFLIDEEAGLFLSSSIRTCEGVRSEIKCILQ